MQFFLRPFFIVFLLVSAAHSHGVHSGQEIQYSQPQGLEITLRIIGSNSYARTETLEGYTVFYNEDDQTYYYATLNGDGTAFTSSGQIVGLDEPDGLEKHLKISASKRKEIAQEREERFQGERKKRWKERVKKHKEKREKKAGGQDDAKDSASFQSGDDVGEASASEVSFLEVSGAQKGLTILVQFPDDPNTAAVDPTDFPTTQAKIERYCNEVGYSDDGNTGSVRDYFTGQSEGALDYTMTVTPIVTLPNARDYYNYSDYPTNATLRDNGQAGVLMIQDAITELNNDPTFSFDGLSVSGNNVVSTNIFFAGATSGVWSQGLWPHQWSIYSSLYTQPEVVVDGVTKKIFSYQVTNIPSAAATIGTFIHESGHLLLDYPDLYDYGGESAGVGRHCIMASGNFSNGGKTPSPINLYFKEVSGWANITNINAYNYLETSLASTGNVGYRLLNPNDSDEYFLFENRGAGDPWAASVPDKGILIWHVDESVSGNENEQMTDALHYEVSLVQSDGDFDLENDNNSGDSGDAYDSANGTFSDLSAPDAKWWDGSDSELSVQFTSTAGANMTLTFGVSDTIKVLTPLAGGIVDSVSNFEITWAGNITGNVNIELLKGGSFLQSLATNEANDGSFTWVLNGGLVNDNDYSIKIFSVDDPALTDTSATFTIASEVFAGNGIFPAGWGIAPGADMSWVTTSNEASEGSYSIVNEDISEDETASISVTDDFEAGSISLDVKVSTESGYDFFQFYIDGVAQDLNGVQSGTGLSGTLDWTALTLPISAGTHTLTLAYEKDFSVSSGSDSVWVDNVVLPLAAPTAAEYYTLWIEGYGAYADASLDSDNDGVVNLIEYATGGGPDGIDTNPTSVNILEGNGDDSMTLSLNQRVDAQSRGLIYSVWKSQDLENWDQTDISTHSTMAVDSEFETVTYKLEVPVSATEPQYFMRVGVSLAE